MSSSFPEFDPLEAKQASTEVAIFALKREIRNMETDSKIQSIVDSIPEAVKTNKGIDAIKLRAPLLLLEHAAKDLSTSSAKDSFTTGFAS